MGFGLRSLAIRFALLALVLAPDAARADDLVVLAPVSLEGALGDVTRAYEQSVGDAVAVIYGPTRDIAARAAQGSGDVVILDSAEMMDELAAEGVVVEGTRFDVVANRLALVVRQGESAGDVTLSPDLDIDLLMGERPIATAHPRREPAGQAARAALQSLRLYDDVAGRFFPADTVRGAAQRVADGRAGLGIVYASEAVISPDIETIGLFPTDTHAPIVYPAAEIAGSDNSATASFLRFLASSDTVGRLERYGFLAPGTE